MTSNPTLTRQAARHHLGRSASSAARAPRAGQQFRGTDQGLPHLLEGADGRARSRRCRTPPAPGNLAELDGLGRPRRHERGDASNLALPSAARRDVEHQRSGRGHGPGRGHASGRRSRGRARDADGHVHAPRPDRRQGVPRHGQAARGHPAGAAGGRASCTSTSSTRPPGPTLADSGTAGAAGNATLVNPDKAALTGDGRHAQPRRLRRLADRRVRGPARRHHGGHDRDERRLRHPDRPGQRRRSPPVELRPQDELRRDRQRRLRAARSSAPTPGACAPA